jgi:hypothetical protein
MVAGIPRSDNIKTEKNEWETPAWLIASIAREFHPEIDLACTLNNCKFRYGLYRESFDSLREPWADRWDPGLPATGFLNPSFGRGTIEQFVRKAFRESRLGITVVCLVPFSGDGWFRRYVTRAAEIRMLGRVSYIGYDQDNKLVQNSPTFSSCLAIFKPDNNDCMLTGALPIQL